MIMLRASGPKEGRRTSIRPRGADIKKAPRRPEAAQAALDPAGEHVALEGERHPGRDRLDPRAGKQIDSGVDEAGPAAFLLLHEAADRAVLAQLDAPEPGGVGHRGEEERRLRPRGVVPRPGGGEVRVAVAVAVHDHRPVPRQEREREAQGARGAERRRLPRVAQPERPVRPAERLLDPLGLPPDAEHRVAEARRGDLVEHARDERTAPDVGDDLRAVSDRRAQPRAEAAGQDGDRNAREVDGRQALRNAPWGSSR
jgi:hypothetical protein